MSYEPTPRVPSRRLAGRALRCFTAAAELPLLGAPLRRLMLSAAGIPAFRLIPCDEAAIVAPPLPIAGGGDADRPSCLPSRKARADAPTTPAAAVTPAATVPGPAPGTAAWFAAAYRHGTATPETVAETFLSAVAQSDGATPPLRAFRAVDAADVRDQARASALRHARGDPLGPLDGVPVAVKDELDQVPYSTTVGTRFLGSFPVTADATVVARLRAAGVLLVGKTNMHEVGLGVTGLNPHHGTSRNPHDPARITGGSSGGSAAAVAAGLCPAALGADAGGSVRIPAGLCGVVGLKPTFGRLSERGAAAVCWSIAHVGCIGATAADVAAIYAAVAGTDPLDPNTHGQPMPVALSDLSGDLAGLTVGVFTPWFDDADADVVGACQRTLDGLAAAGATLREVVIPDLHLVRPVHSVTAAAEWAAAFARQYREDRRVFGADVRLMLLLARSLGAADYVHAQRLRRRVCTAFATVLREVDVIATPTTAGTAPPVPLDALGSGECDFATLERLTRFVTASNLTGLPAISFPAGHDERGLPVGIQLIGRPWREDVLLRVAAAAEHLVTSLTPRVHYSLLTGGAPAGQIPAVA